MFGYVTQRWWLVFHHRITSQQQPAPPRAELEKPLRLRYHDYDRSGKHDHGTIRHDVAQLRLCSHRVQRSMTKHSAGGSASAGCGSSADLGPGSGSIAGL